MKEKSWRRRLGIIIPTILAITAFVFVAVIAVNSANVKTVVVTAGPIQAGETITAEDVKEINVSSNIQGFGSIEEVVGLTAQRAIPADQILYMSNFQSSIFSAEVPANFVVTTINIPRSQAVGGALAAGDKIDVSGVSDCTTIHSFNQAEIPAEGEEEDAGSRRDDESRCVYYILSNVEVLQVSDVVNDTNSEGTLGNSISADTAQISIAVALSYEDTKKIRQAEGVLNLWVNLAPEQNRENDPLIDEMLGQSYTDLHNSEDGGVDMNGEPFNSSEEEPAE